MKKITSENFREFLNHELERRKNVNHRFSLRAFSNLLEIPSGTLSQMLNGKRKLTGKSIERIGTKLKLSPLEIRKFQKIETLNKDSLISFTQIEQDNFSLVSEWYFGVILQFPKLQNFSPSPLWISKKLGLPLSKVKDALKLLDRLNLIELDENFNWQKKVDGLISSIKPKATNEAVKRYLSQQMELSQYALDNLPIEQRNHTSMSFPINKEKLPQIIEMITQFRRKLLKETSKEDSFDEVFQINISLFPQSNRDEF